MRFDRAESARSILTALYEQGFVESVFNTADPARRSGGWILKSGVWSPWYINLRPLGASPDLAWRLCQALARLLLAELPEATGLVGIDMAGVPLVSLVSVAASQESGREMPFLYTRPLPGGGKVRTAAEARQRLSEVETLSAWGGHQLVEGRMRSGDVLVLVDDVATSFGSKEIAREWVLAEAKKQGVEVRVPAALVAVDRGQGAQDEARRCGMRLLGLIELVPEGLEVLARVMRPAEHAFLAEYLEDPERFQDVDFRTRALERARRG